MKVLLASHAAWRRTGYGGPVRHLVRQWRRYGHSVDVLAQKEYGPAVLDYATKENETIRHYMPPEGDPQGESVYMGIAHMRGCDLIVSLCDPWVLKNPNGYGGADFAPWIAWFPVDQSPPQRGLAESVQDAQLRLAFSEWGASLMNDVGVASKAMRLGVDLDTFRPMADNPIGFNGFAVGLVASNLHRDRKNLENAMFAFSDFARTHKDATLVVWSDPDGWIDLPGIVKALGLHNQVIFGDVWSRNYGATAEYMALLYSSFDVLLLPSAAEGFGLPLIEAMACGTPVIAGRNSSMTELVPPECGWLIEDSDAEYSWLGGWWRRPTVAGIQEALEAAYDADRDQYAEACIDFAGSFDWRLQGEKWDRLLRSVQ